MQTRTATTEITQDHLTIILPQPYAYAGTAVLGDGVGKASRIVNLRVRENFSGERTDFPSPKESIAAYAAARGWKEGMIGMLTSASMDSYASSIQSESLLAIETHLTAGLSNARAAGDTAEYRVIEGSRPPSGTINTILVVHYPLELRAALELLMICSGAKARFMNEAGIRSRVSDAVATGTGTDSTVVLHRPPKVGETAIEYAGMHTLVGELAAKSVMEAMSRSPALN